MTEWERFTRARQGDESAWRELIAQYQPRLMSLALLITGSPSTAEDIVQETFFRALDSKIKHDNGTVRGYLATIAYRLAFKEYKRIQRHQDMGDSIILDNTRNVLDNILLNERDYRIAEIIRGLDSRHREVLVLRFYGDHSYEEIAKLLQISLGTVKSRMSYAVKSCRKELKDKGILE